MTRRRGPADSAPRLFSPEQMRLRATGPARFRSLARRPGAPLTRRQMREDEDEKTMRRLQDWGETLAGHFGLQWKRLIRERGVSLLLRVRVCERECERECERV